jgi:hypothetical protein
MPGWLRRIRAMLGMGLTFSVGAGAIASVLAAVSVVLSGFQVDPELGILVVGSAVWAFPIGVAFSGFLALAGRNRRFEELSLPRFALLGAGGGLLLYGVLALKAWDAWTVDAAVANLVLLTGIGAGSATGALVLARRAQPELEGGDELPRLDDGRA